MRADIVPGAVFPDYELSDHRGKHRTLSELQQGDPLVLVLSRGGFCPKERRQHEGLVQLHREMQVGYCRLVTISTDNLLETNEFRAGVGAHWTFLSDPGRKLQKDLDIAEYTDPHHNPMIPHTLVLEPGLRVYKIYNGYWFFGRPTVEELRLDLRAVLQRCRPDWDISSAEQRAAWAKGEKASFFPYGKTQAQLLAEQRWWISNRSRASSPPPRAVIPKVLSDTIVQSTRGMRVVSFLRALRIDANRCATELCFDDGTGSHARRPSNDNLRRKHHDPNQCYTTQQPGSRQECDSSVSREFFGHGTCRFAQANKRNQVARAGDGHGCIARRAARDDSGNSRAIGRPIMTGASARRS